MTLPRQGHGSHNKPSERVLDYRRKILELLFTERNHICSVCVSNGHCDLQALTTELGMTHVHYDYLHTRHAVDASHERFSADHNRCVLCQRCVRVCEEIEGAHTWDVMGRGYLSKVITDLNQPWGESTYLYRLWKMRSGLPYRGPFGKR